MAAESAIEAGAAAQQEGEEKAPLQIGPKFLTQVEYRVDEIQKIVFLSAFADIPGKINVRDPQVVLGNEAF